MRTTMRIATAGWTFLAVVMAQAQDYPVKPIRILTYEAGGGSDVVLRIAATVAGCERVARLCVFAPARTPPAVIQRLNQALISVMNIEEVKKRVFDTGGEVVGSAAEDSGAYVKAEIVKWGTLIRQRGIRA